MLNLPNWLTVTRIFLVPLVVVVILTKPQFKMAGAHIDNETLGVVVFLLASLTDFLDGYLARKRNEVTTLGKLLDPIADKLLTAAAFIALVEMDVVPSWMVVIIVGREIAVTGLRNAAASRGVLIPASALGKGKMVFQVAAIFGLLLSRPVPALRPVGLVLLWIAVAVALISGVDYVEKFRRLVLNRSTKEEPSPSA